jgi:hypothetical protein
MHSLFHTDGDYLCVIGVFIYLRNCALVVSLLDCHLLPICLDLLLFCKQCCYLLLKFQHQAAGATAAAQEAHGTDGSARHALSFSAQLCICFSGRTLLYKQQLLLPYMASMALVLTYCYHWCLQLQAAEHPAKELCCCFCCLWRCCGGCPEQLLPAGLLCYPKWICCYTSSQAAACNTK